MLHVDLQGELVNKPVNKKGQKLFHWSHGKGRRCSQHFYFLYVFNCINLKLIVCHKSFVNLRVSSGVVGIEYVTEEKTPYVINSALKINIKYFVQTIVYLHI